MADRRHRGGRLRWDPAVGPVRVLCGSFVVPGGRVRRRLLERLLVEGCPWGDLRGSVLPAPGGEPVHRQTPDPSVPPLLIRAGDDRTVPDGLRALRPSHHPGLLRGHRAVRRDRRIRSVADLPAVEIGRAGPVREGGPAVPSGPFVLHLHPSVPEVRPGVALLGPGRSHRDRRHCPLPLRRHPVAVGGREGHPQVKAHLSVLLGFIVLVKSWGYFLGKFDLLVSPRGAVTGASYTDVHAQLPALRVLTFIAIACAILFL